MDGFKRMLHSKKGEGVSEGYGRRRRSEEVYLKVMGVVDKEF